ncbi:MAG: hypothetical protein HY360_25770 [Verrucomicrobia bacterium]|nr:hypothetical protein [Verrucomicrobiota bacterium]
MKTSNHRISPRKIPLRVYTRFEKRNLVATVAPAGEAHLGQGASVELQLFRYPSEKVQLRRRIRSLRPGAKQDVVLPLAGIPSGACLLRAVLTDRHGEKFPTEILQDKAPPPTWWLGSGEGVSRKAPAPWAPLKTRKIADGLAVECWGRTYEIADSLLARIHSAGQSLLAAPVKLIAKVNGRNISWKSSPPRVQEENDRVVLNQNLSGGDLSWQARSQIEFDGMIRVDWLLSTRKTVRIDALALDIPIRGQHAKYLFQFPGQWPNSENARQLPANGVKMSFRPFLWLGDEERGLAWFCESNENWFGQAPDRSIEITRKGDIVRLRLRLVSTPINLFPSDNRIFDALTGFGTDSTTPTVANLRYTFGFQATPVKPVEKDAWDFRAFCLAVDRKAKRDQSALDVPRSELDQLVAAGIRTVVIFEHWTDIEAHVATTHGKLLKKLVRACQTRGLKVLLYFGFLISDRAPEWRDFGKECLVIPKGGYPVFHYWPQPDQSAWRVCLNSVWQDFVPTGIARAMDEFGVDGVYLDGTANPLGCTNSLHGCGVPRPDGSTAPTYPIFAGRSAMRRIYNVVRSRKPDGQINVHNSACMTIPTLGWATGYWDGEQFAFSAKTVDANSVLPLDAFRTEFMGHPWGVPAEFLCYGRPFTYRQAWAFCLLHDVPVRPSFLKPDLEVVSLIWKVMDEFGRKEAEWLPYWRNAAYVTVRPAGAYASLYRHPKNGLLAVVSNLGKKPANVAVKFNLEKLGFRNAFSARDALTAETVNIHRAALTLRLKPLDWKLIWGQPACALCREKNL